MCQRIVQPDRHTDTNIIRRMCFECRITKATNTDPEYVIIVVFPRQQWLRKRTSKSRFNVHCLSPTTPVWTDRDKLHVIREPPGSDQRYRPEKTIPCTPETSVIVISTRSWYKLRELWGCRATRWRSWFRHCAISREVAVTGIFHSGRSMTMGSTKKRSTRNIAWDGKGGRCVGLTTLPPSCTDCHEIWEPQPAGTLGVCVRPVQGSLYLRFYCLVTVGGGGRRREGGGGRGERGVLGGGIN